MDDTVFFTLLYGILCFFAIYPPVEFISSGFTIQGLFSAYLGSENENFILYHIKKSIVTILVYSCLPLGYILFLLITNYVQEVSLLIFSGGLFWQFFFASSLALPFLGLYLVRNMVIDDYKDHPIVKNLSKFTNNDQSDWRIVGLSINSEFRRIDKITIQTNPLVKIVATENWILKLTPFTILLAHQSDTSLLVKESNLYETSAQFLTIEVKSARSGVDPFSIRINASDFKDLEDRIARDIAILPNVKFHKSVVEQFVDVFKETAALNERYTTGEELELCIGCMQVRSNVKLRLLCGNEGQREENRCGECFCRPMWCLDCMAKWFASRQEVGEQSAWLGAKCTCPMCRARFCVLDVSMIES